MSVWNKVLYCLIAVTCAAFAVFAANKYALTKDWEAKLAKQEADLVALRESVQALKYEVYGGDPAKKTAEAGWNEYGLTGRLARVRALLNGETFVGCAPIEAKTDMGQTTVSFGVPATYQTSSFRPGATAYLFDSGVPFVAAASTDSGADSESAAAPSAADTESAAASAAASVAAAPSRFLGTFKIVGAAGTQTSLVATGVFSEEELTRLADSAASGDSWIVCVDRLPIDSPTDVAAFAEENPESLAGFDDATRALLAKAEIESSDSPAETDATRFPIAFQAKLENQLAVRDAFDVFQARRTTALANLIEVFFDQLAEIGTDVDLTKVDAQAELCKTDAEAVRALFAKDAPEYAAKLAAAQKRTAAPSYFELANRLTAELAKTTAQRDLVAANLQKAKDALAACEQAIAETISENTRLASAVARAQIAVAEKIERESRQTASVEPKVSYSGI